MKNLFKTFQIDTKFFYQSIESNKNIQSVESIKDGFMKSPEMQKMKAMRDELKNEIENKDNNQNKYEQIQTQDPIDKLTLERKNIMIESIKIRDRYEESKEEKTKLMVMSKIIEKLIEKNLINNVEYDDNDTFNLNNGEETSLEVNINWNLFDQELLSELDLKNLNTNYEKIVKIAQLNELEIQRISKDEKLANDFHEKARAYEDVDKMLKINEELINLKNKQISYISSK